MLMNELRRAAFESSGSSVHSLLTRVQLEENSAWERLVALYEPLVLFWCQQRGLSESQVAETVEQVFRAVAVGIVDFHPIRLGCSFRDWVRKITENILLDSEIPLASSGAAAEAQARPEFNSDAEEDLLFHQALQVIKPEFAALTFEIFGEAVLEQKTPAAIAEHYHLPLENVRLAKSRVLHRLREEFGSLLD